MILTVLRCNDLSISTGFVTVWSFLTLPKYSSLKVKYRVPRLLPFIVQNFAFVSDHIFLSCAC